MQTSRLSVYIANGVLSFGIASGFLLPFIEYKGIGLIIGWLMSTAIARQYLIGKSDFREKSDFLYLGIVFCSLSIASLCAFLILRTKSVEIADVLSLLLFFLFGALCLSNFCFFAVYSRQPNT